MGNHLNYQRIQLGTPSPLSLNYFFSHAHLSIAFEWNWELKSKKPSFWLKIVPYFPDQGATALQRPGTRLVLHLIWRGKEFWKLHRALILMCTHRQNSVWADKSKLPYVIPCLRDTVTAPFTSKSNNFFLLCFPLHPEFPSAYSSQLALAGFELWISIHPGQCSAHQAYFTCAFGRTEL